METSVAQYFIPTRICGANKIGNKCYLGYAQIESLVRCYWEFKVVPLWEKVRQFPTGKHNIAQKSLQISKEEFRNSM